MRNLFPLFLLFSLTLQTSIAQDMSCSASKKAQAPPPYYSRANLRSDTFNILKYTISLEIGSVPSTTITGNTSVRFAPKMNGRTFIRLDLLKLIVDSVKENNTLLTYAYNDTILKVNFANAKNVTDTSVITIFYRGTPQIDLSGWGGFYFDNSQGGQYAYNLGVGFAADPHNYGRVWFPCFDNFVERSKYEFNITSDSLRRSYCGGTLISDIVAGSKRTRKWMLNEEIPTYLASVSVARYSQVNWSINALNGQKPIVLAALPGDTSAVKSQFVNLPSCIHGFENYFGPYKWNRVGYCIVPFNSGAMEHATNIAYPRNAAINPGFEELMAHELSHHWWGNLITCETQEDMWINEGMATFSGYMFYEWQYGKASYLTKVKNQHEELLHFLHKNENGFRAISGVPHNLTYGDHVYKKGADVAHTLRGYLGDSAFFAGCKYVMQQKAYQSINSDELRNLMQTGSGQNLTDFFNNWVYEGGWSHFAIDSVTYTSASPNFNAVVHLRQKLYGTNILHSSVPLEISFFKNDWSRIVRRVVLSGATGVFTVSVPFMPVYAALNYDNKISDATSHEVKVIKTAGNHNLTLGKLFLQVQQATDSSLVRVIHNYVKPDPFLTPSPHKLSDQHFWKVEGIFSPSLVSKARFNYDGNKGSSGAYTYLDTLLAIVSGDSIGLFYRPNAATNWQLIKNATKQVTGSRTGHITVDTLKPGEYAFGNIGDTNTVSIRTIYSKTPDVRIYPNPADSEYTVELTEKPGKPCVASVISPEGKIVIRKEIQAQKTTIDIRHLAATTYTIKIEMEGHEPYVQKLIKK